MMSCQRVVVDERIEVVVVDTNFEYAEGFCQVECCVVCGPPVLQRGRFAERIRFRVHPDGTCNELMTVV